MTTPYCVCIWYLLKTWTKLGKLEQVLSMITEFGALRNTPYSVRSTPYHGLDQLPTLTLLRVPRGSYTPQQTPSRQMIPVWVVLASQVAAFCWSSNIPEESVPSTVVFTPQTTKRQPWFPRTEELRKYLIPRSSELVSCLDNFFFPLPPHLQTPPKRGAVLWAPLTTLSGLEDHPPVVTPNCRPIKPQSSC